MVNLFSFGCHVIDRAYVRTYASTDCTGGVGETIKRKGGVSQACIAKSTSFTLDIHNMVNWQLSKQDRHWLVSHDRIAGSCVNSLRWRDLFGPVRWPVNYFTRSRSMFSLILSSQIGIEALENWYTYWTSMLWSIDSCQNKASAD